MAGTRGCGGQIVKEWPLGLPACLPARQPACQPASIQLNDRVRAAMHRASYLSMLTTLSLALNTPSGDLPVAPQGTSTERRMDMAAAVEGEICGHTHSGSREENG